jgi:UDP-2,4-diacetamido-2,4,6-trideoxy-beta-L-altropyranose hydrolase
MSARALLVADCGAGVGLGHLERMLALADALRPEVDPVLAVPAGDAGLQRRVEARGHRAVESGGDSSGRAEALADSNPDAIVLDGYVFDVALQTRLRQLAPLVVVDDLCLPAACDIGVNPSAGGEALRPVGADAFLGGAAYALLRDAYADARETVLARGRAPRTVLLSTGAIDLNGIIERVAGELLEGDPTLDLLVVVGDAERRGAAIAQPRRRDLLAPPSLADALAAATVYTGAAGTTALQAACVGIPAAITAAAGNQEQAAAALGTAGCALVTSAEELASSCLSLLDDPARCEEMARRGRALVDGRGAARVADAVRGLVAVRAA